MSVPEQVQQKFDKSNEIRNSLQPDTQTPEPEKKEDYEQKYKVLQGKYNAEMARARADIASLRSSQQVRQEPERQVKKEELDLSEYGEEFVTLTNNLNTMQKENDQLKAQMNNVQSSVSQQAQSSFFADLERQVPDWSTINTDENFVYRFLQDKPLYSPHATKKDALLDAQKRNDLQQVVAIFNEYKQTLSARPSQERTPSQTPPMRASSVGNTADNNFITRDYIKQYYSDIQQNRLSPQQVADGKQLINNAQREGRIR